jgi:peptidylprolyl isomerase
MSGAERRKAAAAAAKRRRQQRRVALMAGGVIAVIVAVVVVVQLTKDDSKKKTDVASTNTTTSAAPAAGSAAGKPCVAVADPLPAGAPAVPVKVGPPPTELIKEDLKEGAGAIVNANETVTVNYIGVSCSTGKIFDSSYSRNEPATFPLNQVIKGWTDGIPGMKVGGQRLLGIPADQAYGAQGRPGTIAPDEPLWFVVEVTDAKAG